MERIPNLSMISRIKEINDFSKIKLQCGLYGYVYFDKKVRFQRKKKNFKFVVKNKIIEIKIHKKTNVTKKHRKKLGKYSSF